jgi:hypothetical protein
MRIREFSEQQIRPTPQQLMALAEYLLGQSDDAASEKTVPITAFLSMASNMGVPITDSQLRGLASQDPLKNVIVNVTADEVVLSGAGSSDAGTMSVDQARDTVAGMADSANDLT